MFRIEDPLVDQTLQRLHHASSRQGLTIIRGLARGIFRKLRPEDMRDAYLPLSRDQGEFLYDLLVRKQATNVVEFGTSFGVSTLYLAAAMRQTGGRVITTELLANKCTVARRNFADAGLEGIIDLREGDAMATLKSNVPPNIDLLLLDGWNDLYLPLLQLLEPLFRPGTLIYTDNASFKSARPFLEYLRQRPELYRTARRKNDKGGAELTEYIGRSGT